MGWMHSALCFRLSCALLLAAVGCRSEPAANADAASKDWGTGIVAHERAAPAVVTGPRVATAQALAAGQWDSPKQMYDATCGGCHGKGVGPHILGKSLPAGYIQYVGRNGLRAMPPFRPTDYTDAELASLATWINSQPRAASDTASPQPAPTPAAGPAPAPASVTSGSSPAVLYTLCSGCHDNGAPVLRGRALLPGYVNVVVRNGLRGMPAFDESRIADDDLMALVAWLNTQPRSTP